METWFKRLRESKVISWRDIVWWTHLDLCRLGIDTINLLCAAGIPGAEKMDIGYCLRKIDEWAAKVQLYTEQMLHHFERHPERYGNSLAYFKALCLVTVLQRDCGVRYNPAKSDPNVPLETADSFIFGIIQGDGGTCASLPVLYCAVGHQLNYPMFLVHTKAEKAGHGFVQWDDGEVRFNIEATGVGMATPTDDHYRTGKFFLSSYIERAGCFLRPNNLRHSLAKFLAERSHYWMDVKAFRHAVEAMGWAAALHPENRFYLNTAKIFYNKWLRCLTEKKPPRFPDIYITGVEKRRFPPTFPLDFELQIHSLETMECLINDLEHNETIWEPLRRGQALAQLPVEVECYVSGDGCKHISFLYEKHLCHHSGEICNV